MGGRGELTRDTRVSLGSLSRDGWEEGITRRFVREINLFMEFKERVLDMVEAASGIKVTRVEVPKRRLTLSSLHSFFFLFRLISLTPPVFSA